MTKNLPPEAITLVLTAADLRDLLQPVIPLAASERDVLPVLAAINLRGHGDYLTAWATDRYRIGVKRLHTPAPETLDALLPVESAKAIVAYFKPSRNHNPEVTLKFGPERLTVSTGMIMNEVSSEISYRLHDGEFPAPLARILETALDGPMAGHDMLGINLKMLAGFTRAVGRDTPLILTGGGKSSDGRDRPIGVSIGDDFRGAIMPNRLRDDAAYGLAGWGWALQERAA